MSAAIMVARLLEPSDFALAGLGLAVFGLFRAFMGGGFAAALVRQDDLRPAMVHSVFWFMVCLGGALAVAMVIGSPFVARFYGQQALAPILCVLAVAMALMMAFSVPDALLRRDMRFAVRNIVSVAGAVAGAILGIVLAWLGWGAWALIVPRVGSALALAAGAFVATRYVPALVFRWREFKSVAGFGAIMMASAFLLYLWQNIDYLVMGRFWQPAMFGYYYFAFERARQPLDLVMTQVKSVIYPAFSLVQGDFQRLRRGFLRGTYGACLVVWPIHLVAIILADPLIPLVFGAKWRPAVLVFQVFASVGFVRGLCCFASDALLAIGRPHVSLSVNVLRIVVILPTLLLLGSMRADIHTVAVVLAVLWQVMQPINLIYLCIRIRLGAGEIWATVRRLVLACIPMAAVMVALREGANMLRWPAWSVAVVSLAGGGLLYIALMHKDIRRQFGKRGA